MLPPFLEYRVICIEEKVIKKERIYESNKSKPT